MPSGIKYVLASVLVVSVCALSGIEPWPTLLCVLCLCLGVVLGCTIHRHNKFLDTEGKDSIDLNTKDLF